MYIMKLLLNLLILATVSQGWKLGVGQLHTFRDGIHDPRQHRFQDGEHNPHFDHETFLGDKKEAELFDELPPEEAKDRLGLLAKKMDKDDDGFIDKKELGKWLSDSIKMLSLTEAETNFKEHDTDNNGFIEWKEYKDYLFKAFGKEGPENPDEMIKGDKVIFDAADDDKDGKLDVKEYQSFLQPYEHLDKMAMVMLAGTHKIQDINKDGKIDLNEYMKGYEKDTNDATTLKEAKDLFQKSIDKNGDGTLDKQEIIDWLGEEADIAGEQTEHLFSEADDNKDGKLSMKEIVDHHDVFVGSEVTGFGDHLLQVERFEDEL